MPKTPQEEFPKGYSIHIKLYGVTDDDVMVIHDGPATKRVRVILLLFQVFLRILL